MRRIILGKLIVVCLSFCQYDRQLSGKVFDGDAFE